MHVFPAAYHAIFHEKEAAQVVDRVREFVVERFAAPDRRASLLERGQSRLHLGGI